MRFALTLQTLRKLALLAVLCLLAHDALANDLLRLYGLALEHDSVLQAALYQREATVEARPLALAQWLPHVAGSASSERERSEAPAALYGLSTDGTSPPALGAAGLSGCALASSVTVGCNVNYSTYGVTLTQTLWSFSAYSQLKEADSQAASAEAAYLSAQQNLVLRVAQAYFGVLQAQDELSVTGAERAAFAEQLRQTQGRQQTGVGSRSDVEQAQSYYDLTAQRLIDAHNALDDAQLALMQIINQPAGPIAALREQIPLPAPEPTSIDAWVAAAQLDNPDMRAAQLQSDAAGRDIGVQRGKGLPTVSLTGTAGRTLAPLVLSGDSTLDTVGVYFSWPLFQGGAVSAAVHQSRALYQQSKANLDTVRRDTVRLTRTAYRNVVSGIQSILAARRAVASASTAVEAARRDIEFNVSPEFVLLQYQQNYYAALIAYDQVRYAYLDNTLILKQQAGRLSERDLAAIDALLVTDGSGS